MNPQFPVYIVSKSRWDTRLTDRALDDMQVPHYIVVEEQQVPMYAATCGAHKLLILDPAYQQTYETCDKLGDTKSRGPGPARNFAWAHSMQLGAAWHWVMDDNITAFYRLNRNRKIKCGDGTCFRVMEDFCLRWQNLAMAGPNYEFFVIRKQKVAPLVMNTRIYSCNLIRNDQPFRWRGRYNEDTDLSLRQLKAGWCTVEFNAFLQKKMATQRIQGGNTEVFYSKEGTLPKSQMLVAMHPDVTKLVQRWGRWHHLVDYSRFQANRLKPVDDAVLQTGPNEYHMTLREV